MRLCLSCEHVFESEDWRCPRCGRSPQREAGFVSFSPELAASNDGYDPDRFGAILPIENEHFLRRARNRLFTWSLQKYFPQATNFLEIGSGIGVVLKALRMSFPELVLWGTEIYSAGLKTIVENVPGVRVFQADARRLPFREEFDVIGAFDVLEHIDDDVKVLREMHRATRPGGGILVSVPQHPSLWSQRDESVRHKRRYTRQELIGKIRGAGFEIRRTTSFVALPFPLVAFAALRNRRPRADYDPFAEFRIGTVPAAALNFILSCERQAIKAGVSFPFGGTLLAVAMHR